nr:unnamed protein product [Callosobruchus chinensis]
MGDKELQEARNCVKEANLFEENMTVEEIKETYRMIQMSKKSKEEDEKKRSLDPFSFEMESDDSDSVNENIHSLVEELCSPSTLRLQKKEVTEASEQDNKGDNNLNGLENLNLLDATKVKFGYLDMPPMEKCDHQLINHKSNFVALQQTEEYCNANCATKVKMLSWHWSKISKTEPGRHSKRKCYATSDDESNDVNTTPKKSKTNDRKWQSNSSNNDNNLNSETKIKTAAKKRKSTPIKDIEKESKSESDSKNLDNVPTLTPLENEEELLDNEEPDALEERFGKMIILLIESQILLFLGIILVPLMLIYLYKGFSYKRCYFDIQKNGMI